MMAAKQNLCGIFLAIFIISMVNCTLDLDPKPLTMAAFNVRIFGVTKMSKPAVKDTLIKIVLRYDVILIQEVRDSSDTAIHQLLDEVNSAGQGVYQLEISARSGRSASKEQYAFIYRKDRVSIRDSYNYDDGSEKLKTDTFEREPFVVRFNSPNTAIQDFACIAIHTSPSKAAAEVNALATVYDDVVSKWNVADVIIMGDFNAACDYVRDSDWANITLATDKRFYWLIPECVDTTVSGGVCAYDRFVIAGDKMREAVVPGSSNSFRFDIKYGLSETQALEVSDHYPIEMKLRDKVWEDIEEQILFERKVQMKDKRVTKLSNQRLYKLSRDTNPLLEEWGFSLRRLYKNTGGVQMIILESSILKTEDEVVDIVALIRVMHPDLVTMEQVKSTRSSLRSLVPRSPSSASTFPYQTEFSDSTHAQYRYKVELTCEFLLRSCFLTLVVTE